MTRLLLLVSLCVGIWLLSSPAQAQPISRNNPFRGFNLSGVNYGSQQWERENRGSSKAPRTIRPQRFVRPLFRGR